MAETIRQLRNRLIREELRKRLTETQYRRLGLMCGFNGPALSERQAAETEGVSRRAIRLSVQGANERLPRNWKLLLLWVSIWVDGDPEDTPKPPAEQRPNLPKPPQGEEPPTGEHAVTEEEVLELVEQGGSVIRARNRNPPSGSPLFESEKYAEPPTPMDAYADGWMAYHEDEPMDNNPYGDVDKELADQWQDGWLDASWDLEVEPFLPQPCQES